MTEQAITNLEEVAGINHLYHTGELDYDKALESLAVVVNRVNTKGKEIAKKYSKKYYPLRPSDLLSHGGTR